MYKTIVPKKEEQDKNKKWYVIDLEGKTLGRASTKIANILRGKDKPIFSPHVDCGDYVIILNAQKVHLTGNKMENKMYYRHSGYPSGLKTKNARDMIESKPEDVIRKAVYGMLPKNKLRRRIIEKLFIYADGTHKHEAQKPETIVI